MKVIMILGQIFIICHAAYIISQMSINQMGHYRIHLNFIFNMMPETEAERNEEGSVSLQEDFIISSDSDENIMSESRSESMNSKHLPNINPNLPKAERSRLKALGLLG